MKRARACPTVRERPAARRPGTCQASGAHAGERCGAPRTGEEGQSLILAAAFSSFLLLVGYFAVNIAVLVGSRTAAQRAADAAALAGCAELPDQDEARAMAILWGSGHNSTSGEGLESGNSTAVTFSTTLLNSDTIRAEVWRSQRLIGYGSLGIANPIVRAHAVCRRDEGSMPALLTLGFGSGDLAVQSGVTLRLGETGLVVNSTAVDGLTVGAGASVEGRFTDTGSGRAAVVGALEPPPTIGTYPDPFALVPLPAPPIPSPPSLPDNRPGCDYQAMPNQTSPQAPRRCRITGGAVQAGIYWGGLELGDPGGGPTTVTLEPGAYVLAGGGGTGGLLIHPNTRVVGDGVIVYSTTDPAATPVTLAGCGALSVGEGAQLALTPPTSGPEEGVLFFQDLLCAVRGRIGAGATVGLPNGPHGALYLPAAEVEIGQGGGALVTSHAIVVAARIVIAGDTTFALFIPTGTLWHGRLHLVE